MMFSPPLTDRRLARLRTRFLGIPQNGFGFSARMIRVVRRLFVGAVCSWCVGNVAAAELTLESLLTDPKLTPKNFTNRFEHFEFEAHDEVQQAEAFLRKESGDCDDFAVLADYVLRQRGYSTRLVHVRLVGRFAHAVCYVVENKAYLDYNNRIYYSSLEKCGRTLREIANKVADTFQANWTTASEFTFDYQENRKRLIATVVKTDPPSSDPDSKSASSPSRSTNPQPTP